MQEWWAFPNRAVVLDEKHIHDGDTLRAYVDTGFYHVATRVSLRLDGIDTPELNSPDPAERVKGLAARERLRMLLPVNTPFTIETRKFPGDRYGRWLARVYTPDGRMVNDLLVAEGHARLYSGGKK